MTDKKFGIISGIVFIIICILCAIWISNLSCAPYTKKENNNHLAIQTAIYGYRVAKEGKLTEQQMIERLKMALDKTNEN